MRWRTNEGIAVTIAVMLLIGSNTLTYADSNIKEFDLNSVNIPQLKEVIQPIEKPQPVQPITQQPTQPMIQQPQPTDGRMPERITPLEKLDERKLPKEEDKKSKEVEKPKEKEEPKVEKPQPKVEKPKVTKPKPKPKKVKKPAVVKAKKVEVKEEEIIQVEEPVEIIEEVVDLPIIEDKQEEVNTDKAQRRALNSRYNIENDRTQYQLLSPIETDSSGGRKQYITRGEVADMLYSTINMDVTKPAGPYMDLANNVYELPANVVIAESYMTPIYKTEFGVYEKLRWNELASIINKITVEKRRNFNEFRETKSYDFGNILMTFGDPYTNPTKTKVVRAIEDKVL